MIRLVGPGGAGKSTIGALLAERLALTFLDLDRQFAHRVGDISDYIGLRGYETYARENVETYLSLLRVEISPDIVALSSGFMTYSLDIHPEYQRLRHEIETSPTTFVLLPSVDRDVCVRETVRRQLGRPFGRPASSEEAVIRTRFEIYMAVPAPKIETIRPIVAVVDEIVAALLPQAGIEVSPAGSARSGLEGGSRGPLQLLFCGLVWPVRDLSSTIATRPLAR